MSRIGAAARKGATVKRTSAPRAKPAPLPQRERERRAILRALGATTREEALERCREIHAYAREKERRQEVARAAWSEAERAVERERLTRRVGVLARLRDGAIALVRRVDRMPPGAERLDAQQARAAIETAPRRVVVGVMGTASPPASKATFAALAAPLLEAA